MKVGIDVGSHDMNTGEGTPIRRTRTVKVTMQPPSVLARRVLIRKETFKHLGLKCGQCKIAVDTDNPEYGVSRRGFWAIVCVGCRRVLFVSKTPLVTKQGRQKKTREIVEPRG